MLRKIFYPIMRLFVALPTSPEANGWILQHRPPLLPGGARWLEPDMWHLTLVFIGERDEDYVETAHQAIEPILQGHGVFRLRPTHIGWRGRTLWVHLESDPVLECTVKLLHEVLGLRFSPPFLPHITIARSRRPLRWEGAPVSEQPEFVFSMAYLYQSVLHPTGAEYTPMRRYFFRASSHLL